MKKLLRLWFAVIIIVLMCGVQAWGDVVIDETNFPDYSFRNRIINEFDLD